MAIRRRRIESMIEELLAGYEITDFRGIARARGDAEARLESTQPARRPKVVVQRLRPNGFGRREFPKGDSPWESPATASPRKH